MLIQLYLEREIHMAGQLKLRIDDLPEEHWDLLLAFMDVIEDALRHPAADLDHLYVHLRRHFVRDTGMCDLVPDFVEDCPDTLALARYLARMEVALEEQITHMREAFDPLGEYMELVFRPRTSKYARNYWPSKPRETPFSPLPPFEATDNQTLEGNQADTPLSSQAQRVLRLAPLALEGLERLLRDREPSALGNAAQPLLWEEVDTLHRLHRELGVLLRLARGGRPFEAQLATVGHLVQNAFKIVTDTGELMVAGIPPLAASALPAYGTFKVCETMLRLDATSSATVAAGVIAGSFALRPNGKKGKGGKKRDGEHS